MAYCHSPRVVRISIYANWTAYYQGRAEDFRIGVALTLFAHEIFLSATPNFRLFGVALGQI